VGKELKIDFGDLKHFQEYKANKTAIIYGWLPPEKNQDKSFVFRDLDMFTLKE